jgi:hypothetical protein
VANTLRDEDRRELQSLTAAQRVALALALGDRDLEAFRLAGNFDSEEAARLLGRRRQAGRRPSRCLSELVG